MQKKNNLLLQDRSLSSRMSFEKDRILLSEVLKLISLKTGRRIISETIFKKDHITLFCPDMKVSDIMDSISSIWSTYWKFDSGTYVLKRFSHNLSSSIPKDQGNRDVLQGLYDFKEATNNILQDKKQMLAFSEGINPSMKYANLTPRMQDAIKKIMTGQNTANPTKDSQFIEANLDGSTVGFRYITPDSSMLNRLEMMVFNGRKFISMSFSDVLSQKKEQDSIDNSPVCYSSQSNNRYLKNEVLDLLKSDYRLTKSVSLNTNTVNCYRAWSSVARQVRELGFICYSDTSSNHRGKGRFQCKSIPLKEACNHIARQCGDIPLCWELRKSGMMVLRVRFVDDDSGWGPLVFLPITVTVFAILKAVSQGISRSYPRLVRVPAGGLFCH